MELRHYTKEEVEGKRVLLRCDLDVKVNDRGVVDEYHDLRLERIVPTLAELYSFGALQIVIIGHRGRPKAKPDGKLSLVPVRDRLGELCNADGLDEPITFIDDVTVDPSAHHDSDLIMLENLRFWSGEKAKEGQFSSTIARWGDIYINDAFGNSHRDDASMTGITSIVKLSFAGPELIREVRSINGFLESLQKPFVAILGGAKITTKLPLLNFLATKADYVLLGGALANTVFASQGMNTGKSLIEESLLGEAKKLTSEKFVLPIDAVVTGGKIVDIDSIGASQAMLDIGPRTIKKFVQQLKDAKTILWNGPMGKYEDDKYSKGTFEIAHYMAEHQSSNSLSGGGETVEVIERLGLVDSFDFVSTGGGAMLTMLSGEEMPALEALY